MGGEHWMSAHLFCAPPWEDLLLLRIEPLARRAMAAGDLRVFFFIRYFEGGPHLRVRFQCGPVAQQRFAAALENVAREEGRARRDCGLGEEASTVTVRWIGYEPEYDRYGGAEGVAIAERHFFDSTNAVLAALRRLRSPALAARWEPAVHLCAGLLGGLGVDPGALMRFLPSLPAQSGTGDDGGHVRELRSAEFGLARTLATLWRAARDGVDFTESWFTEWTRAAARTRREVVVAVQARRLTLATTSPRAALEDLAASYLHMTFNRLGIIGPHESSLFHCVGQALARNPETTGHG